MKSITITILTAFIVCLTSEHALAAEGAGSGWGIWEPLGRWLNLLILVGVIYFFTKTPVRRFFEGRRDKIQEEIREAQAAREEAESKLAAMEERMRRLDDELKELKKQADEEAARETARVQEQTELDVSKIQSAAKREIEGLTLAARQDLRTYASQLAVELAKEQIQAALDAPTQEKLFDHFVVDLTSREKGKTQ